jgi:hypothetical protein
MANPTDGRPVRCLWVAGLRERRVHRRKMLGSGARIHRVRRAGGLLAAALLTRQSYARATAPMPCRTIERANLVVTAAGTSR